VKAYLERWGFEVDGFTSPLEALSHFKENACEYSLVLSDIRMPGMNGLELAIEIRKIKSEIRFVLMTAFELSAEDLNSMLPAIRYDELIHKPFKLIEICTAVKKQLQTAKS
jgi:DNA-binding response OmpR family regulator